MRTPRSRLAIGFYAVALLYFLGKMSMWLGLGVMVVAANHAQFARFTLGVMVDWLIYPVLIALFGGVVQILSDIRWALLNTREGANA